ncbi:MAG: glucose-6-phosphate dehydrogenase [Candidatus Riflebacteria bacterium HGW-Riflebacteria-1]|jgi:glucose-6-phosphate 1-dehydrogenase|nr:MAG: glucose-6-phosphate dehydrogenase [Candidatus Riflebacteria bacterium HGW-Riflebacteria-1]
MSQQLFCAASIVIFGGTGDLASRKLLPALCRLHDAGLLTHDFHVFVTGRADMSTEAFLEHLMQREAVLFKKDTRFASGFNELKSRIRYLRANPSLANEPEDFKQRLLAAEPLAAPARLFYLAVPPSSMQSFISLIRPFSEANTDMHCPERILVEKPFGQNLASARELNQQLLESFKENQILRIDHYLGKEAVQNILFMRFANTFFEPVWNNHFIDNIQISFSENIGIGGRAEYFDQTGILRDVVQNHLLQVLSMVAMEPPLSHKPGDLHLEKNKVLKAIRKYRPEDIQAETIRAQYVAGEVDKKPVVGYLSEDGVRADSKTETYSACRVFVDNWRWGGVPFYLQAGKRLERNITEIVVSFKPLPYSIFKDFNGKIEANRLHIRIQPHEGIILKVNSKPPGMELQVSDVGMRFSYDNEFGDYRPDAYERLLLDALNGDSALFLSNSEIEESWKFIDPIIDAWHGGGQPMFTYKAGSQGPEEAGALLAKNGHYWHQPVI